MKYLKLLLMILVLTAAFSSCTTQERKAPTYDQLLEEHERDNFSVGGAIAVFITGVIIYQLGKRKK